MFSLKTLLLSTALLALAAAPASAADPAPAPIDATKYDHPIVLACVGDSITADKSAHGYPAVLAKMLGDKWTVGNYGVSSTTLMTSANKPYQKQEKFQEALASKADVVIIMLGTNDAKPKNWALKAHYVPEYKDLIAKFKAMESKPRIFIATSPYIAPKAVGFDDANVLEQMPLIAQIAREENVGMIDVHSVMAGKDGLTRDGVHPVPAGAKIIAETMFAALTGKR